MFISTNGGEINGTKFHSNFLSVQLKSCCLVLGRKSNKTKLKTKKKKKLEFVPKKTLNFTPTLYFFLAEKK
jgi:hypothetical protein